jgi:hypothetical protein
LPFSSHLIYLLNGCKTAVLAVLTRIRSTEHGQVTSQTLRISHREKGVYKRKYSKWTWVSLNSDSQPINRGRANFLQALWLLSYITLDYSKYDLPNCFIPIVCDSVDIIEILRVYKTYFFLQILFCYYCVLTSKTYFSGSLYLVCFESYYILVLVSVGLQSFY